MAWASSTRPGIADCSGWSRSKMVLAGAHVGAVGLRGFAPRRRPSPSCRIPTSCRSTRPANTKAGRSSRWSSSTEAALTSGSRESPTSPRAAAQLDRDPGAHDGGGTRARDRPSRPQTGEYSPGQGRAASRRSCGAGMPIHSLPARGPLVAEHRAQDRGFRPGQAGGRRFEPDANRHDPGHAQLHGAGTGGGKNREIGPAADIYSLGAILYELLVGRPPFRAGNPIDTIRQVIEQEPVPPRQLEPRVPHDLETICLKCLEKDPARRFRQRRRAGGRPAPVRGRRPDPRPADAAWERAWKWGKRRQGHRGAPGGQHAGRREHGAVHRLAQRLAARASSTSRSRKSVGRGSASMDALEEQRLALVAARGAKALRQRPGRRGRQRLARRAA